MITHNENYKSAVSTLQNAINQISILARNWNIELSES